MRKGGDDGEEKESNERREKVSKGWDRRMGESRGDRWNQKKAIVWN